MLHIGLAFEYSMLHEVLEHSIAFKLVLYFGLTDCI